MPLWTTTFEDRTLRNPSDLINLIPETCRLAIGHAAGEPTVLVDALLEGYKKFKKTEFVHMVPMGSCRYCEPGMQDHFIHNSLFVGGPTRKAVAEGRAEYTPVFFSQIPSLFREKMIPIDVALICVSPPDENGWMSYGVSVDYTQAAAESARLVVAEVNELMPRTLGSQIHVSKVDYFVRSERPLLELQPPKIGPIEQKIGSYIADLIKDGDCLQLGIGSIPDAVLSCLQNKNDLGIHTEMFSDGVVDLAKKGVITNRLKNVDPGKMVATFLMGTKKLYDFVHNNRDVLMLPVDYTNNILVAGRIDHLISINSALEVDLMGQVCADMIGPLQFSSVGGQVDFVRAAAASKGGRSVIALPSTAKGETISRIVPHINSQSSVTTSRFDVDTIVTEFGVAHLKGKTARQRKKALIDIAHPMFRDYLSFQGAST